MSLGELVEQAADCGRRYTLDGSPFYALSLSAVIDGRTEDDVLAGPPLRGYPKYHRMRAGDLYLAGFTLWATFRRPEHYDVRLPSASPRSVLALIAVAGPLLDNRHHER